MNEPGYASHTQHARRHHVLTLFWLMLGLAACSGNATESGGLGIEGASCLKTGDCEKPLQCLQNVCTSMDAARFDTNDATTLDTLTPADIPGDGLEPETADLDDPPTEDAILDVLADYFGPDSQQPEPKDTAETPDLLDGQLHPWEECEELGIASKWVGTFDGTVDYSIGFTVPGAPPVGSLPVLGTLAFEIQCIEEKLVVVGEMDGMAQLTYPFKLKLLGSYNPDTGTLSASMKDGSVTIVVVEVLFEGTFSGTLQSQNELVGKWDGYSTGTNPANIPGTATGQGNWYASPAGP